MQISEVLFMFNEFEKDQKEKAFNYSKLRFENMDKTLNDKSIIFRDDYPNYSYFFIAIANFISFKEDIWIKNKRTKNISTNFSKEILDDFVFKGKFKTTKLEFSENNKQKKCTLEPFKINKILKGKENDSVWIIDNVRDSIAHGHYYINFDNLTMVINNTHEDRLLNCEINYDLFTELNELITEERIGGYTDKKLTTTPTLYILHKKGTPFPTNMTNRNELINLLKNKYVVSYCQVQNIKETDLDKKYNDLIKFYNYNVRVNESMYRKFNSGTHIDIGEYYSKKMIPYIESQMQNYDFLVFSNHLDDNTISKVINYVEEDENFYNMNLEKQGLILHQIIKFVISHEEPTIEYGVTSIAELYNLSSLKNITNDKKTIYEVNDLIFSNVNTFKENKKLANLFILGTNNFVSNKESIYDKYFDDYSEFNLSNFEYQDYSGYERLLSKLKVKNDDLSNLNKTLYNATLNKNKLNNNLIKAPNDKKAIIQNNINNLDILINELNIKINNITLEINELMTNINQHKTDSYGDYINNNNKSFFNHLRNAFAHNNIKYLDDRITYNRKIVLEDYDDNKKLTFRCVCRYYDLVKLFNNELFLQAINNNEIKKREK